MKKKRLALLLAALSLLALVSCGDPAPAEEPSSVPTGVAVRVTTVESRDISTDNRVSGVVTADDETSVYVSTNAKVTAVYFEAGDTVAAGDILCTLELGSTLASYNAAQISYNSSAASYHQQKEVFEKQIALYEKQIALYEKTLSDARQLFEIGAASQLEIDQAELQLDSARLQLVSAEAQRDSTLSQLRAGMESYRSSLEQLSGIMEDVDSQGNVIAPASGTLASISAVEGGFVSASYPVAVISGAEQMKVTVYVSEALMPKLAVGDAAQVALTAANIAFTGAIRTINRTANIQTKLYSVVIGVPSDIEGLASGMFADVTFHTDTSAGAIVVPSEAIMTSNGEQYVYVVEDGRAKYAAVITGITGDGVSEVLTGLSAGQTLVTVGQQYLSDGDAVRIVDGG